MSILQWVDSVPPVESPGHAGPAIIYYLFPDSSPLDLEPLSVGAEVAAELGARSIRLTKTKHSGRPWLDPETNIRITSFRAAQLGFRNAA